MKRSLGIDFVRTLAILLVIFRHYHFYHSFNYGIIAIECLFVISGFLIGQILFADFFSTSTIETASLKRFMIRRWFRILPLYYLCLFVKFAIDPSIGWNILYYVFFLQNHFYGIQFYPETWTLVIDEWFYLAIPLMIFLFLRFISVKQLNVFLFISGVIVAINIARYIFVTITNVPWAGINGNVVFHQDVLLFGVLMAYIKHAYKNWFNQLNTFWVFLLAFSGLFVLTLITRSYRYPVDYANEIIWLRTISFGMQALLIMLMLPWLENSFPTLSHPRLSLLRKTIVWGSKLSYALYLVHNEVYALLYQSLQRLSMPDMLSKVVLVMISILISFILYKLVEKPLLILRDKYFPDRKLAA